MPDAPDAATPIDRPSPSWEEAIAALTAPGAPFALTEARVHGRTLPVFERTPPSLRELFAPARQRGDAPFLVYEDETWSFAKVMAQADALGHALVHHYGVERGDRVAIAMRNYPEYIAAFAAITSIGAIAVCLNAWWTTEETTYGLDDSTPKVVIADPERAERARPAMAGLGIRGIEVRGEAREGFDAWSDVVVEGNPLPDVEIHPDDDALILYTSGTTGFPKGAVSTHRAVLSALTLFACRTIADSMCQPPREEHPFPAAFILCVPLFHVTGLVAVTLSCFAAGYKLVIMYKWDPARALELIERERITNFVGVPTMSWDLLECPDFARRDTQSLKSVGGGGAPAPPELVQRVERAFARGRPGIGYGMTETNAFGPQNGGDAYVRKPRSAGRIVPPMRLEIRDTEGKEVPVGQVGEIWFFGPNLFRGYWNKPEATAETLVDGWLRSGDIGRVDEEGFVYVEDRAKDMVLRAGENVYCAEVEAALYQHPAVYEAVVFGVPHERLGEEVACAVHPKPGHALDPAELQAFLREHIAGFKVPTLVDLHDEALPRNASGKILKRALRDALAERLGRRA
jgi:long-chain acyl-CoA synthetase